jgi:hypothetical protein
MPKSNSLSNQQKRSLLEKITNLAEKELVADLQDSLDQTITSTIPKELRVPWIKTAASQIAYHYVHHPESETYLGKVLGLNLDERAEFRKDTEKKHFSRIIDTYLLDTNHPLSSFVPPKTKQLIIDSLELDSEKIKLFKKAQQAAFEVRNLKQKPVDASTAAKNLLDNIPDDREYGVNQKDAEGVLEHISRLPSVINNPTQAQLEESINNLLLENYEALGLSQAQAQQFGQHLLEEENLVEIHKYVRSSTEPLPSPLPFNPWRPTITPKDIQQAKNLKASPLALSYVKAGFKTDDPLLSKDIQSEVKKIHAYLSDPLNPENKLSIRGYFTALSLNPQVKLAQTIYHPIYRKIETLKAKSYKSFLKPALIYESIQKEYHHLKTKNKLGWLIAPRFRAHLFVNDTKINFRKWGLGQIEKHGAKLEPFLKAGGGIKSFWKNWSPKGIKEQSGKWIKGQALKGTFKLGDWLLKRTGGKALGKILIKAGEKVALASTGVGVFFALFKWFVDLGFVSLKKLRRQIHENQDQDGKSFDLLFKVAKSLLTGLKTLGMLTLGTTFGVVGGILSAAATFFVVSSFATPIVGALVAIPAFFIGGGAASFIGGLIGWNWMSIAAVPVTVGAFFFGPSGILGGGLTGSSPAILAGEVAGISSGITVVANIITNGYLFSVVESAFSIGPDPLEASDSASTTTSDSPSSQPSN